MKQQLLSLIVVAVSLFLIVLGELLTYQALVAFFFGIILTIVGLVVGIIVLLTVGEEKAIKARDLELKKKTSYEPPPAEEVCPLQQQKIKYIITMTNLAIFPY